MLVRMLETPPNGAKIEVWSRKIRNILEVSTKIMEGNRDLEFNDDDITNMI